MNTLTKTDIQPGDFVIRKDSPSEVWTCDSIIDDFNMLITNPDGTRITVTTEAWRRVPKIGEYVRALDVPGVGDPIEGHIGVVIDASTTWANSALQHGQIEYDGRIRLFCRFFVNGENRTYYVSDWEPVTIPAPEPTVKPTFENDRLLGDLSAYYDADTRTLDRLVSSSRLPLGHEEDRDGRIPVPDWAIPLLLSQDGETVGDLVLAYVATANHVERQRARADEAVRQLSNVARDGRAYTVVEAFAIGLRELADEMDWCGTFESRAEEWARANLAVEYQETFLNNVARKRKAYVRAVRVPFMADVVHEDGDGTIQFEGMAEWRCQRDFEADRGESLLTNIAKAAEGYMDSQEIITAIGDLGSFEVESYTYNFDTDMIEAESDDNLDD